MSDYNPGPDEGIGEPSPPESGPDDFGQAVEDGQPTEQPEAHEYLEVDEVADRYVRVTVDGEQLEVPLKEALAGYSRQSDYTRKTQDLAAQRQQAEYALAVQRALEAQPEETIWLLSRRYGLNLDTSTQSPPPTQPGGWEQPSLDDGADEFMDPLEKRIMQQERILAQMASREEERAATQQLNAAIGGLQRKYQADDSIIRQVVGTALQTGQGPASFDMIYRSLAYDREQAARQAALANRQAQEAARGQAKAANQQLIGNGASAASAGGQAPGAPDGHMSIQEAFDAALRTHGVEG